MNAFVKCAAIVADGWHFTFRAKLEDITQLSRGDGQSQRSAVSDGARRGRDDDVVCPSRCAGTATSTTASTISLKPATAGETRQQEQKDECGLGAALIFCARAIVNSQE